MRDFIHMDSLVFNRGVSSHSSLSSLIGKDTFMRFGTLLYFIKVFEIAQKLLGNVQV